MFGFLLLLLFNAAAGGSDLEKARDAQDRPGLERMAAQFASAAQTKSSDAQAQYRLALAESYVAEVAIEVRDKNAARAAAEAGMDAAKKAIALNGNSSEYHRLLGTLCGQAISASPNILQGMKYGHCAQDEVNKALQLDPKSSLNYLAHGVGNYYMPQGLGGGPELAAKDFLKAAELDPQSAEAQLWLGLALRKENKNAEARKAFQKAIELNPARVWARLQLEKTPAQ
jgi:tetratricopeptide (TPR) repeat protein